MKLELEPEEREFLHEVLEQHYRELLWELARADRSPAKSELREQVRRMEQLLEKTQVRDPAA